MQTTVHHLGTLKRDLRTGRFVKTFTLSYATENGIFVRTLPAAGITRVGTVINRCADRGTAWDIEVLDKDGVDVTFDFECFQS